MKSPCNISRCNWYTFKLFIKKWRGLPQRANFKAFLDGCGFEKPVGVRVRVRVSVRIRVRVRVRVRVGVRDRIMVRVLG